MYTNIIEQELEQTWDAIIDREIATREELILVTSICGHNIDTLNSVLYSRCGYRSLEQMDDCE